MRLVFLCGCLEPGRDGVGDYTRRLAAELIKGGNDITIISLNDSYVEKNVAGMQESVGTKVNILRCAKNISWQLRIKPAQEWIENYNPDWISLQFVPFSFHPKGLMYKLPSYLKQIAGNRKWHIMFHELWVGMEIEATYKMKVWGWVQKILIKKLIHKIKPGLLQTQSPIYIYQLNKMGFDVSLLPLFSNIPVILQSSKTGKHKDVFILLAFGSLHPSSRLTHFVGEMKQFANQQHKKIVMKFAGRNGHFLSEWEAEFAKVGIETIKMGELGTEQISDVMLEADLGISATPFILSQKSGSVAAMLTHRLPVICLGRSWNVNGFTGREIQGVFDYIPGQLKENFMRCKVPEVMPGVTGISSLMMQSFLSIPGSGNN